MKDKGKNIYKALENLGFTPMEIRGIAEVLSEKLTLNTETNQMYSNHLDKKQKILENIKSGDCDIVEINKIIKEQNLYFFTIANNPLLFSGEQPSKDIDNEVKYDDSEEIIAKYLANNRKDSKEYYSYKDRLYRQNRLLIIDNIEDTDIEGYISRHSESNIIYVGTNTIPYVYKVLLVYKVLNTHIKILNSYLNKSSLVIKKLSRVVEMFKNFSELLEDFTIYEPTPLVLKKDSNERMKEIANSFCNKILELKEEEKGLVDEDIKLEKDFLLHKYLFED